MVPVSNSSVFRGEPWKPGRHFCSCSSSTLSFPFPSQQQQPHDAGQKVFKKCRPELQPPGGGREMILCKVSRCWANREFIFNSDPKLEETFPCQRGFQTLVNRVCKQTQPAEQDRAATSAGGHRARVRPSGPWTAPRSRAAANKGNNSTLQHSSLFSEQTVSRGLSVLIKKGSLQQGSETGARMQNGNASVLPFWGWREDARTNPLGILWVLRVGSLSGGKFARK